MPTTEAWTRCNSPSPPSHWSSATASRLLAARLDEAGTALTTATLLLARAILLTSTPETHERAQRLHEACRALYAEVEQYAAEAVNGPEADRRSVPEQAEPLP